MAPQHLMLASVRRAASGTSSYSSEDGAIATGAVGGPQGSYTTFTWEGIATTYDFNAEGSISMSVSMLLDLDEGTLTVFKNGEKLGDCMHRDPRLRGKEFSWAASLYNFGASVRVRSMPPAA